jgi:PAS domain S-box-containing protein
MATSTRASPRRALGPAGIVLALIIFFLDAPSPLGMSIGTLYVVPVLLGLWTPWAGYALAMASLSSVLSVTDVLLSPPGGSASLALVNRPLTLAVIWVTATLVFRQRQALESVAVSMKELSDVKYALDQAAIVAATDTRGIIQYANDKFCEISKYSREELIGQDHRIINSGYHPKEFIRNLWTTIANGRVWRGEIRNRAKDGSIYWVDTTIVPLLDESGRPFQYMAIRSEITERKRAEAQLREQATLARLGEMAAVVAHEVKNPIAGIRGALQVIASRTPADSRDRAIIGDIIARLDALNGIVQDMLLFARPRQPRTAPVPLLSLLNQSVELLKRDPATSHVQISVIGDNCTLEADAEQLGTVFVNLLLNAAQAMHHQGEVGVTVAARDGVCEVLVRDHGPGVPADLREQIFEPFVTTKHRGTGLGLPIARRIVELHHGHISLECPASGGTVVRVTLPAAGVRG